jgi:hypothetical protein
LPLHVKPVRPLDLNKLKHLEVEDHGVKERFIAASRWITDDGVYKELPGRSFSLRDLERAKLYTEDVREMLEAGQVREIPIEQARGTVHLFAVAELAKARRRAIKHTKEINDRFDKATLLPALLPTRAAQSQQSASGKYAITLDFAAWFDQFELAQPIQTRMCFRSGGKSWALTRMPMGQRHAVAVAQNATNVLLSFPLPDGVTTQSCIDNVRFVGPKEGVVKAAGVFVQRCRSVGVTINELPDATDDTSLGRLVHQLGDWLGAEYNYASGVQRVASKSMKKLALSWEKRAHWTHRQYAAHMGLLFFTASVLRSPLASFYEAIKQLRLRSAALTRDDSLWSEPVIMSQGELESLTQWTDHARANAWTKCTTSTPIHRYLITDASGWGWGAMLVDTKTGTLKSHGQAWTADDKGIIDTEASTSAEPEAVLRALQRFFHRTDTGTVSVLTDSTTARYALGKGYSASFAVNAIAARVRAQFPNLRLQLHHIAGVMNPVDALSRNGPALPENEARRVATDLIASSIAEQPSAAV